MMKTQAKFKDQGLHLLKMFDWVEDCFCFLLRNCWWLTLLTCTLFYCRFSIISIFFNHLIYALITVPAQKNWAALILNLYNYSINLSNLSKWRFNKDSQLWGCKMACVVIFYAWMYFFGWEMFKHWLALCKFEMFVPLVSNGFFFCSSSSRNQSTVNQMLKCTIKT